MNYENLKEWISGLIAKNYLKRVESNLVKLVPTIISQDAHVKVKLHDMNSGGFKCYPRYNLIVNYSGNDFKAFCKAMYPVFPKTFFYRTIKHYGLIIAYEKDSSGEHKDRYIF